MVKFKQGEACAVVTGGGDGMGLEIALNLVKQGCSVCICDISQQRLDKAEQQLRASVKNKYARTMTISTKICDVANENEVNDLVRHVLSTHRLTNKTLLLFNNAGVGGGSSLVKSTRKDWDRTFAIDWGGVLNCTRAFLPTMLTLPAAHIINTSSICGFTYHMGYLRPNVSYSAAKAAVRGFTLSLVEDFKLNAPHIKATCVMPGWIGTGLIASTQEILSVGQLFDIRKSNAHLIKRISELEKEGDIATMKLKRDGLLPQFKVDLSQFTDEQLQQLMTRAETFRTDAITSAKEAANIILDGVSKNKIQILVGEDAWEIDNILRANPNLFYEDSSIVPDFFNFPIWEMNRRKKKEGTVVKNDAGDRQKVPTKSKL